MAAQAKDSVRDQSATAIETANSGLVTMSSYFEV